MLSPTDLAGLNVIIVGAAREGLALVRYLVHVGARVTLTDTRSAEALAAARAEIAGLPITLALGGELPTLNHADVILLSPGVPPYAPIVQQAREQGIPLSSEPRLFTQLCPAPIVGITGSSGKTTTTSLVGRMFTAAGMITWVGGNIGTPLTDQLIDEPPPDVAVMELSSFQLELFSPDYQGATTAQRRSPASRALDTEGWSPHIALITNITPNHLDRHPDMADYAKAKRNIMAFQQPQDVLILNAQDSYTPAIRQAAQGQVMLFSLSDEVEQGAFLRDGQLVLRNGSQERLLCAQSDIPLRGMHNVANVLAAACCGLAGGLDLAALQEAATTFAGVAHRLEVVGHRHEVTYINDSIATAPERAIAALQAFDEPLVLLAGGRDKHLPWNAWADLVLKKVRLVVAFGEATPIITQALADARQRAGLAPDNGPALICCTGLEDATAMAAGQARPGDIVLLSPGGTSFDAFVDFEARGERFRELVAAL